MFQYTLQQAQAVTQAFRNERLSPEQVSALQNRKLRALIRHVWNHNPFYRQRFQAAGVTPADVQTVADLVRLPVLTKHELRAVGSEQLLSNGYTPENTVLETTSGSTGKRLPIYHDRQAWEAYHALVLRHLWGIGYRPWHRLAYLSFDAAPKPPWVKLGLGAMTQIDLAQNDPRRYLEDLLRIQPQTLMGMASLFKLMIHDATPAELARIRPQVIYLHSELLTDSTRALIRDAFQCDVCDDYSTFEFHQVASECRHHRYHIAADHVVVEVARHGQPLAPGEEGEILITGLDNLAMPLIRYAIGDVGLAGVDHCSCGRGFPTMQLLQGRVDDYVILPSGRRFSPRMINPIYEELPGIVEHVLVQETIDHLVVYLQVAAGCEESTPGLVQTTLQKLFAEPIHLEVKLTQEFERGRTEKLRNIISKVKPETSLW